MPSYLPAADYATRDSAGPPPAGLPTRMVAFRAADLQDRPDGRPGAVLVTPPGAAPQRQRIMSPGLAIRLTIAMTLMPESPGTGSLRQLAGLLPGVAWPREWHVPVSRVRDSKQWLVESRRADQVSIHGVPA